MFLLFAGDYYYPQGGWDDFRGAFGSLEAAQETGQKLNRDWWHIVNVSSGEIVENH
jgi:hypothetical protein